MFEDILKKLNLGDKGKSLTISIDKERMYAHYQQVSQEIERGEKNEGVWAKAFVESKGDLQQTKVKYIELMVERYILAEESEKEALRLKEEEERLKAKKIKEDKEFAQFLFWGGVVIVAIIIIGNIKQ